MLISFWLVTYGQYKYGLSMFISDTAGDQEMVLN